ncbi:hypothetical protein WMY93_032634 [Mugilogobius chulae]|uniref:Uncharacterized protein n=1 Tax=Mugilogobius chulae TaxID=88201 RepID=A0AAW0MRA3_9GOBI
MQDEFVCRSLTLHGCESTSVCKKLVQSSAQTPSRTTDQDQDQRSRTEPRRIRAPRGDLSSLMNTLTSSNRLHSQEVPPTSTSCCRVQTAPPTGPFTTLLQRHNCVSYNSSSPRDKLHFYQHSSPSYDSFCSESDSNVSFCLEEKDSDKTAASSSQNFYQNPSLSNSLRSQMSLNLEASRSSLRSDSNASLNLDRTVSPASPSRSEKRLSVSSNSSSFSSSSRSFSLRKSKRPPAPPERNESLKRRPKPPRASLEKKKCEEQRRDQDQEQREVQRSAHSPHNQRLSSPGPAHFGDPWVPRIKRRQSGLNCGTTSTFEPKEEPQKTTVTQRRPPVVTPASPTPPCPPPCPPPAPPPGPSRVQTKSRPKSRSRSRSKSGQKPRPPERTTSLLSSFSSSSSLSSCASETSIKQQPAPPTPPPLPVPDRQLPVSANSSDVFNQRAFVYPNPVAQNAPKCLPDPPPLPASSCLIRNAASNSSLPAQNSAPSSQTPPPPPPPPLPPSVSLPPPPPLPDFNHKLPACHYQICTSPVKAAPTIQNSIVSRPSLPPPPPLPSRPALPPPPPLPPSPQSLPVPRPIRVAPQNLPPKPKRTINQSPLPSPSSKMSAHKMSAKASPSSPLVTTQALRNVKLRSVKSQEFTRTNSLPTMEATESENLNLELLRKKANSATSINDTPEDKREANEAGDGRLTEKETISGQDASNPPTKPVSEEPQMYLSAKEASDDDQNGENVNVRSDLNCVESNLQEEFDGKASDDSKSLVYIPNVTEENCEFKLNLSAKQASNEKIINRCKELLDGKASDDSKSLAFVPNVTEEHNTFETNLLIKQASYKKNINVSKELLDGKALDESNIGFELPKEKTAVVFDEETVTTEAAVKETNVKPEQSCDDEFSLDEIEKILRDLEACVEDSDAETVDQNGETDPEAAAEIVCDAREFEAAQTGRSLDDSERNNAQIKHVRQYKLQTTESYFRTQDQESPSTKSGVKERNQAYLDMYALLAESTTTRLNRDDGSLSHDGKNAQENRSKGRSKAKNSYYDVNESNVSEFSDKTTGLNDGEDGELKLNGPWVKIKSPDEVYEARRDTVLEPVSRKTDAESFRKSDENAIAVKPSLPKKPDLGILGLLNKTAKRADPVERTSPGKAQNASSIRIQTLREEKSLRLCTRSPTWQRKARRRRESLITFGL